MTKGDFLYEGKAKKIFKTQEDDNFLLVEYKNSLTAFNGVKKDEMAGKGKYNCQISTQIFTYLNKHGVETHWKETLSEISMICEKVEIIPIEVVVRNKLAGSTAKKFQLAEGTVIEKPIVEFYYKKDELGDPFISDEQALMLKAANSQGELELLKKEALKINELLKSFFQQVNIELIDFKLEFGKNSAGKLLLADEISPDTCRLWELGTGKVLDKDRFRKDMGDVMDAYEEVLSRIENQGEFK